jgi:RHS repeat-associated protein
MNPLNSTNPMPSISLSHRLQRLPVTCTVPSPLLALVLFSLPILWWPARSFAACPEAFVEVRLLSAERFKFGFEPYTNQTYPKKQWYLTERVTYQYGATNHAAETNLHDSASLTNFTTNRFDPSAFHITEHHDNVCSEFTADGPTCASSGGGYRGRTNGTPFLIETWSALRTTNCGWYIVKIKVDDSGTQTNVYTSDPYDSEFIANWECQTNEWTVALTETTRDSSMKLLCDGGTKVETEHKVLTNLYTTDLMLTWLRNDLTPYPSSQWVSGHGFAALWLDPDEQCAKGTKMHYRLKFQGERDVTYLLRWDEVTRQGTNVHGRRPFKELVFGSDLIDGTNNVYYTSEHVAMPPSATGVTTVENVSIEIAPPVAVGGGAAPGSGGPGGLGTAGCAGCGGIGGGGGSAGWGGGSASGGGGGGGGFGGADSPGLEGAATFEISLGQSALGTPAGALRMVAPQFGPELGTPNILQLTAYAPGTVLTWNGESISSVITPQVEVRVRVELPTRFHLDFYTRSGTPFVTWTVETATQGAGSQWQITEVRESSRVFLYEFAGDSRSWTLIWPGGLRLDQFSTGGGLESTTVSGPGGLAFTAMRNFQAFNWGVALGWERLGDEDSRATTWSYADFTSPEGPPGWSNGTRAPLTNVVFPDGTWRSYVLDNSGRPSKTILPFQNTPPGTADSQCRVLSHDYHETATGSWHSTDDPALYPGMPRETQERVQGGQVTTSFTRFHPGEEMTLWSPEADFGHSVDNNNLTNITCWFTTAPDKGRLKEMRHADGTMSFYAYGIETNGFRTNIVRTGAPNGQADDIASGTITVTVFNQVGQVAERTVLETNYNGTSGTSFVVAHEVSSDPDEFFRNRTTTYLDGSTTHVTYSCCGVESTTDRDGVLTQYLYDDLRRVVGTLRLGILTTNTLDAVGRVIGVRRTGTDSTTLSLGGARYDTAGRLLALTNALGGVTAITETLGTNFQRTIHYPEGGTRLETYFRDGRLASVTGDAGPPVRYEYDSEADGGFAREWAKAIRLTADGADTAEWTQTWFDGVGQPYKRVYAGAGNPYEEAAYNTLGQLTVYRDPDGVTALFRCNARGERIYSALSANRNETINFAADRIRLTTNDVVVDHGFAVHRTRAFVWDQNGQDSSNLLSTLETSVDGLRSWHTQATATASTVSTVAVNGTRTTTATGPDNSYSVSTYQSGRLVSVAHYDANSSPIGTTTYSYDAHGRPYQFTDGRTGTRVTLFYNAANLVSTNLVEAPGQPNQLSVHEYDLVGREVRTVLPDGGEVTRQWTHAGLLQHESGARTYPVDYGYDAQGRLTAMTTWQQPSAGAATTTWSFDDRGWPAPKRYTNGIGPDYEFTAAGRLAKITWARGDPRLTATYTTNTFGDVAAVTYSDSTPGVSLGYDRLGRPATITQGANTWILAHNLAGQLTYEAWSAGVLAGLTVTNGYNARLLRESMYLNSQPSTLNQALGYDAASRLATVASGPTSIGYSYLPNSSLLQHTYFSNATARVLTTSRSYDNLNRLTNIASLNPLPSTLNSASYAYNLANQRTQRTEADGSYWAFGYDNLGQVTSGKKYWESGQPVAGQQFAYAFDTIGNRTLSTRNPELGTRNSVYTSDSLNEIERRTVPGWISVIGSASTNATVTVDYKPAKREGEYFWADVWLNNTNGAVYRTITNVAALKRTNQNDVVTEVVSRMFLPQSPEVFTHDYDGNLTQDGRWHLTWNARNELVAAETWADVLASGIAKQKLDFGYDYAGRRIQKTVSNWATDHWQLFTDHCFVYDGWNLIAILDGQNNNTLLCSFTRGQDLSGTIRGAGGIGGLLAMTVHTGSLAGTYFYSYDGNGNVVALLKTNGQAVAEYSYGPYGELLRATGPLAFLNPFRFSTKYQDDETGWVYYGCRYYDPSSGRWLNRDPIHELGGQNLYGFVGNDPVNEDDPFGLTNQPGDFGWLWYSVPATTVFWNPTPKLVYLPLSSQIPNVTSLPPPSPRSGAELTAPTGNGIPVTYRHPTPPANPFTYDALLVGAPHLLGTPVGEQLAAQNAEAIVTAPVFGLAGEYAGQTFRALRCARAPKPGLNVPFKEPKLRSQVEVVVKSLDETGKPPPGVWQGGRRGYPQGTFLNDRGKLPQQPPGYYKESDVWPGSPGSRGSERLVVGDGGEVYYSPDHYETFIQIR